MQIVALNRVILSQTADTCLQPLVFLFKVQEHDRIKMASLKRLTLISQVCLSRCHISVPADIV